MDRKLLIKGLITFILIVSLNFISTNVQSQASYYNGFSNSQIEITAPNSSSIICYDTLFIEGTSDLTEVWFCVRGPQGELATWKADVYDNAFSLSINLRFGPGQYTIWASDTVQRFDGTIRFLVYNQGCEDSRYTSASMYVDSYDTDIIKLADVIAPNSLSPQEKMVNIHSWITSNIIYDYDAYLRKDINMITASQVLEERKGLCRDFSFLFGALARAANLPTRIVYGEAKSGQNWELHAWNEVLIGNDWVSVDSSWDAGYVYKQKFIQSPSKNYLAPDSQLFALTHRVTSVTVH